MENNIPEEEALRYGGTSTLLEKLPGAAAREGFQEASQHALEAGTRYSAASAALEKTSLGPMAHLIAKSREIKPSQDKSQESIGTLEDIIMNSFIEEKIDIFPTEGLTGDAEYNKLDSSSKEQYDLAAFKFFRQAQEVKSKENPKYTNMRFPNFVKLFIPDDGFNEILRTSDGNGTIASAWANIYDQNTNLMKESALNGLKRAIAASE